MRQTESETVNNNELASGQSRETEIDKIHHVFRGPPDYTFASLPYRRSDVYYAQNTGTRVQTYRMTSPYDPAVKSGVNEDLNTSTGQRMYTSIYTGASATATSITGSTESGGENTQWFKFYAQQYKYYSVLSCRWSLEVENLGVTIFM